MKTQPPTVGVVIITYNYGGFLDEALSSVLAQTHRPDQIVVVDDGSTNQTREHVAALPTRYPGVKVVLAEHGGQAHARNVGVGSLSADQVLCLDGDDRLKKNALEKLSQALSDNPACGFAYGWVEKFGHETGIIRYEPWDEMQLLDHNFVQPSCCLFKRSAWQHAGGWSQQMQQTVGGFDDWAFMLALAEAGVCGVVVPEVLLEYRRHAGADYQRMEKTTQAARAALAQRHFWRYLSLYGPRIMALGAGSVKNSQMEINAVTAECDELRAQAAQLQALQNAATPLANRRRRVLRALVRPVRRATRRLSQAAARADLGPVPVRVGPPPIPALPVLTPPKIWPRVDIVTVLYNSAEHISGLLSSLRLLDYPRDRLHIFFVDNASTDGSIELLAQQVGDLPCSIVRLGQNSGFTGGCNLAMRTSRADYIFLHNPDAQADPQMLKTLVMRALQERGAGMVEAAQQPIEHPKDYDPVTQETSWCTGTAVLLSRTALKRTGVFDERFFMYCEDIDLSWRMWSRGYRCVYEPRARVTHGQGISTHKGGERGYYLSLRNGLMMRLVFGGPRAYFRYAAGLAWLALVNPGKTPGARQYPTRAILAHLRHLPHLIARRLEQTNRPAVPAVKFYGWDYHVRRW